MGRANSALEIILAGLVKRILKILGAGNSTVDVILLGGLELGRLKARFGLKTKGKEPDVLAFPEPKNFPHPEKKGKKFLGEVYLNRDIARSDWRRASFLLIHGILHLLGFSHDKKRDTMKMERVEKRLMQQITNV